MSRRFVEKAFIIIDCNFSISDLIKIHSLIMRTPCRWPIPEVSTMMKKVAAKMFPCKNVVETISSTSSSLLKNCSIKRHICSQNCKIDYGFNSTANSSRRLMKLFGWKWNLLNQFLIKRRLAGDQTKTLFDDCEERIIGIKLRRRRRVYELWSRFYFQLSNVQKH